MVMAGERITTLSTSVETRILNTFVTNPQWELTSIGEVFLAKTTSFNMTRLQGAMENGPIRQWIREENHITNVDMIGIKKSGE